MVDRVGATGFCARQWIAIREQDSRPDRRTRVSENVLTEKVPALRCRQKTPPPSSPSEKHRNIVRRHLRGSPAIRCCPRPGDGPAKVAKPPLQRRRWKSRRQSHRSNLQHRRLRGRRATPAVPTAPKSDPRSPVAAATPRESPPKEKPVRTVESRRRALCRACARGRTARTSRPAPTRAVQERPTRISTDL